MSHLSNDDLAVLFDLLVAAKGSQALFENLFRNREKIRDRSLYWAVSRIKSTLQYIVNLTEIFLQIKKQCSPIT